MSVKGFKYIEQKYRFIAKYKNGKWDEGILSTDSTIHLSEAAVCLHYGQECFEGLKAYRTKSGDINLFRPDYNARRMQQSCKRLCMPIVSEKMFIDACKAVVKANEKSLPEYGTGGTLYIRPFMIGIGNEIDISPSNEYLFVVYVTPVGSLHGDNLTPVDFCTTKYDRVASNGTGNVKVGGNYAASMIAHKEAVEKGFKDCIYLDPITQTKIEEVGSANFFGITKNNEFVTPKSQSILNSITKLSLMEIAKSMGFSVVERDCYVNQLNEFVEVGACGTAVVVIPIRMIEHENKQFLFANDGKVGKNTEKLYNKLVDIQFGDDSDFSDWIVKV